MVERIIAGARPLFEIIMRRYNQRLFRITRAILGDDTEAEDVMQQAYVRAYASLNQLAGRAKFATLLTKICDSSGVQSLREATCRVLQNQRREGPAMENLKSCDPSPEQNAIRNEAMHLLEPCVDTLPELYQSVLVLRIIEQINTAETADCLDSIHEAIKVRVLRARQLLKRELYSRAAATSANAFQFLGARCNRVVHQVLDRLRILVVPRGYFGESPTQK